MSIKSTFIALCLVAAIFVSACKSMKTAQPKIELAPEAMTYENTVFKVLKSNCMGCHSGSSPAGGTLLTDYASVKNAAENGVLLNRINNAEDPMPPNGLISKEERTKIEAWAEHGYKQ